MASAPSRFGRIQSGLESVAGAGDAAWIPREGSDLWQLQLRIAELMVKLILFRRRLVELNPAEVVKRPHQPIQCLDGGEQPG